MKLLGAFGSVFRVKEVINRVFFTAWILVFYRLSAFVSLPGIDEVALEALYKNLELRFGENLIGFMNLFSGGAFEQMTIVALGIQPYISASITMQLSTMIFPKLEALSRKENGQRTIVKYTRITTIVLGAIQAVGISFLLRNVSVKIDGELSTVVTETTIGSMALMVAALTAGTALVMWLGEQISAEGLGQGIPLIMAVGVVSMVPEEIVTLTEHLKHGETNLLKVVIFLALVVSAVIGTIFVTLLVRKIPVKYSRRVVGRKIYGGQMTHIPLKINTTGMLPIIFAVTLMQFPAVILGFMPRTWKWVANVQALFAFTNPFYLAIYASLIVGFVYLYSVAQINPIQIAEALRQNNGFIPGVRKGKQTVIYINNIVARLILPGAVLLALMAIVPIAFEGFLKIGVTMASGASILIVVGVALSVVSQIESQMKMRHHDGILENRRSGGHQRSSRTRSKKRHQAKKRR